jgi:hypothetical protein
MAANPVIRFGGKLAHTQTTVLGLLKKSQQNRAPAWRSCHITGKRFALWARGIYRVSPWGVRIYAG